MKERPFVIFWALLLMTHLTAVSIAEDGWEEVPGTFDPAQVPKQFDIVVEPLAGSLSASEVPIYPWTKTVSVTVNLQDIWYSWTDMVSLVPQQNGHYDVMVYFSVVNPSKKWAYALYLLVFALPEPNEMVNMDSYRYRLFFAENSYLLPLATNCSWNGRSDNVELVHVVCDVIGAGKIKIFQWGNQLRTDVNKDGKVNILDIAIVALHYGERYTNEQWNYDWNILMDPAVTFEDLIAVSIEFGRQIPP